MAGCAASSGGGGAGGSGGGGAAGTGGGGAAGSSGGSGVAGGGGQSGADAGGDGAGGSGPITIPGRGPCTPPAGARVEDSRAAYARWKTDLLISDGARGYLRVRRPNSSGAQVNSTVSEGIAYGMLLAVYNDDQPTFDKLWLYSQQFLDGNGLMHWYIAADGSAPLGTGAATDSDEDMAFALLVADARWGGKGTLPDSYLATAKKQIDLIWQFEVDHTRGDVLTAGDQFGGGAVINISYFAPAFYRAFGRATGKTAEWGRVVDRSYEVLARTLTAQNGNAENGLVPAWSTPDGVPMAPPGTSMPTWHQLDSCRTPYRLAQDACWNNEPRAFDYLKKSSTFYAGVGAKNIVDGYDLNGAPHAQFATGGMRAASFVGTAAAGAMASPTHTTLRDEGYADTATLMLLAGSQYYQQSWTALSLLFMTGQMPDLTAR